MNSQIQIYINRSSKLSNNLRSKPYLVFILPAFLYLLILSIFPLVYSLVLSFQKLNLQNSTITFVGFGNYVALFKDKIFWESLKIQLIFTFSAISLEFLIGFSLALLLNKEIRFGRVFRSIYLIPMMVTPMVVGLMWRLLLNADFGISRFIFDLLGLKNISLLGYSKTALLAVIFVDVWQWTPFVFIILLAGLRSLPIEPFEMAQIDGASSIKIFRYITLPMLSPSILVAVLFRTVDAFREFDKVFSITYGGPGTSTYVLSFYSYVNAFTYSQWGKASAAAYIMLIFIMIIIIIYQNTIFRRIEL
ncbi:MAG: sugar ABC transporter permease [Actinobacteria bacterium]|nr:sugar ABC transporter permease [Actinomycetota bacterium]